MDLKRVYRVWSEVVFKGGGYLFPICTSQIRGIWQPVGYVINPADTGIAPHKGIMFSQPELLKLSFIAVLK